jgi:putative membrane protein
MIGNGSHRLVAAAACASLVGFVACKGNNDNKADSTNTASGDVARSDSAAKAATPAAPTPSAATGLTITGGDSEIVKVLAVVDHSEIEDGRLGQRQAKSSQVKAFARELVTDHSKSLATDRQLAKTANVDLSGVLPSEKSGAAGASGATGVVAQLLNAHAQATDRLKQAQGAAFDSAFVSAQITGHQEVLDMLQRTQAQKPDIQQHVTDAIKHVQDHLDRGQKLQQSLKSGGTAPSDTASKAKSDTGRRG